MLGASRRRARASALLLLLSGCGAPEVEIAFATDPHVLRGNWLGVGEDGTIIAHFDLAARYIDKTSYGVSGTARFGNKPPVPVDGVVRGFATTYLEPQTSFVPPYETLLADMGGSLPYQLCVSAAQGALYTGVLAAPETYPADDDTLYCSENSAGRPLVLKRPVP